MLHQLTSVLDKVCLDVFCDFFVVTFHKDANCLEEIPKIDLVEVGSALLSRRFSELLQSYPQPYLEFLALCILDDCLQERKSFLKVHVIP